MIRFNYIYVEVEKYDREKLGVLGSLVISPT